MSLIPKNFFDISLKRLDDAAVTRTTVQRLATWWTSLVQHSVSNEPTADNKTILNMIKDQLSLYSTEYSSILEDEDLLFASVTSIFVR